MNEKQNHNSQKSSKPIRVVWFCMFVNREFREYFNKPELKDWGVWITHLLRLFEHVEEVDLHVLTPNHYNNTDYSIRLRGIQYHFYKYSHEVPQFTKYISTNLINLNKINQEVGQLVESIQPDIIHLHGVDSPLYCAPALQLNKKFPSVLTIQRFNYMATGISTKHKTVLQMEQMALRQFRNFGYRTHDMKRTIQEQSPKGKFYFHNYPYIRPSKVKSTEIDDSDFDLVFYARIARDKGVIDLIESVVLLLPMKPDLKVKLIGPIQPNFEIELVELIKLYNLESVVQLVGFIEDQEELHKITSQARVCVLPSHADIVPGTIIESMFLKLPVVCYDVEGMSQLNDGGKRIILVEKGNIEKLAATILKLLQSFETRIELAENAYQFANEFYADQKVIDDIVVMYRNIIQDESSSKF